MRSPIIAAKYLLAVAVLARNRAAIYRTYCFEEAVQYYVDSDGGAVDDSYGSWIDVQNRGQLDTDGDGYGNACDCDLDQDLTCDIADLNLLLPGFVAGVPGPSGLVP